MAVKTQFIIVTIMGMLWSPVIFAKKNDQLPEWEKSPSQCEKIANGIKSKCQLLKLSTRDKAEIARCQINTSAKAWLKYPECKSVIVDTNMNPEQKNKIIKVDHSCKKQFHKRFDKCEEKIGKNLELCIIKQEEILIDKSPVCKKFTPIYLEKVLADEHYDDRYEMCVSITSREQKSCKRLSGKKLKQCEHHKLMEISQKMPQCGAVFARINKNKEVLTASSD